MRPGCSPHVRRFSRGSRRSGEAVIARVGSVLIGVAQVGVARVGVARVGIARVGAAWAFATGVLGACSGSPQGDARAPAAPPTATAPAATAPASSVPSAAPAWRALALGAYHTCALTASGEVACWGDNQRGQLGGSASPASAVPVLVAGLSQVVELRAGDATTCARQASGAVSCWGDNAHGEADPEATHAAPRAAPVTAGAHDATVEPPGVAPGNVVRAPVELKALAGARAIALGARHGCALLADGLVTCWGDASLGQLGLSGARDAFQLQAITELPPLVELASAGVYNCGRTAGGDVWCWGGQNEHGQLGNGAPGPAPRHVVGVNAAVAISVTDSRACAWQADGAVACWGDSGGCADTASQLAPTPVAALKGSLGLARASGGCFTCALAADHALRCEPSPPATARVALPAVASVAAGNDHACAIRLDGSLWCWGSNVRGELGRSTPSAQNQEPAPVAWQSPSGAQRAAGASIP